MPKKFDPGKVVIKEVPPDTDGRIYNIQSSKGGPNIGQLFATAGTVASGWAPKAAYWFWNTSQTPFPTTFWLDKTTSAGPPTTWTATQAQSVVSNTAFPSTPSSHSISGLAWKILTSTGTLQGYMQRATDGTQTWYATAVTGGFVAIPSDGYLKLSQSSVTVSGLFYKNVDVPL